MMDDVPMSDEQEIELCSDGWLAQLLDRIKRQRSGGRHLCDVIVACDVSDDVFPAHRCVLAASSDYFSTLFTSGLQGDDVIRDGRSHVTINTSLLDVSRGVVHTVLDFMYTGRISLSLANLPEVLRLADFLRMRELMSLCADYMNSVQLDNATICLSFLHLLDTYHLSLESLSTRVHDAVSRQLRDIFAVIADTDDLPTSIVSQLLADPDVGSVPETEICGALCRLAEKRPHDAGVLDLFELVEFEYVSTGFVRENVLTNSEVVGWLERRRPEALAALRERVERQSVDGAVDVIICGRRVPRTHDAGGLTARLLVYVIQDDEWLRLRSPVTQDAASRSGGESVGCDWLGGLECLVTDGSSLYALCSVHADAVSYVHTPVVIKRFCRLDLSTGGSRQWQRLSAPIAVQSHGRLVVSVDGIYAVDMWGVVERYSASTDQWTVICRDGFPTSRNRTLYVLPMLIGGDSQLCALQVYLFGVGYTPSLTPRGVTLYALDVARGTWNALQRSDIDVAELLYTCTDDASTVNFHSYVATPGSVRLLDELGAERAVYDLVASDWNFTHRPQNSSPRRPNFVGDVLGSVPHAGRVYCACVTGSADFVLYDVIERRYRVMSQPTDSPSGVMCHARIQRSSLAAMTSTAQL